jgi:hypothetical protein
MTIEGLHTLLAHANKSVVSNLLRVSGNSGCKVELVFGPRLSVRKVAVSKQYARRLQAQKRKQREFRSPIQGLRVPEVFQSDADSFVMEYLFMLDSIEFLERATPEIIKKRLEILFDFLRWEFAKSTLSTIPSELIVKKLDDIECQIAAEVWARHYAMYAAILRTNLPDVLMVPLGPCHGDLTLSNVMFSIEENSVGLIDFLDSFVETPLVDLVKLRQDTRFHWTTSRYKDPHDLGKIRLINNWIDTLLCDQFEAATKSFEYWVFECMNLLRIAPYVTDGGDHWFLSAALSQACARRESSVISDSQY